MLTTEYKVTKPRLPFIQQHYQETYRRCVLDYKLSKPFVRSRTAVFPSLRLL